MKKHYYLLLPLAFCLVMASCKPEAGTGDPEPATETPTTETEPDEHAAVDKPAGSVESEKDHTAEARPAVQPATQRQASAKTATTPVKRTATPAQPKGKAETIYVETDGAQGRVWGHVTLHGDRGSGTIHDWDENTLSITVTRHGNELFAVDQNSRQYVFKLK